MQKIAEIVESSTTGFIAQCYELYGLPPLGSLVRTGEAEADVYGIVCNATTSSVEPGRRPIARGRDEPDEEAVYRGNPQLARLLRSEFNAAIVGHRLHGEIHHRLPPTPARIHGFVYPCPQDEIREFSRSFAFLGMLLSATLPVPGEEVIAAALRQMSQSQEDPRPFLVAAGKELAMLLGDDYTRLRIVLGRMTKG